MHKWNGEAIDHLLLHCPVARELWNIVSSLFEVHWVMLHGAVEVELLASWSDNFNRHRSTVIWSMIHHCLIWGIWRERNATFKGNGRSINGLKLSFFQTQLEWANASGVSTFDS